MSTASRRRATSWGLIAASFVLVDLGSRLAPATMASLDALLTDRLFEARAALRGVHPSSVIQIVRSDYTVAEERILHPGRSWYARAVRSIASLGPSALVLDSIFPQPTDGAEDQELIQAVADAGNVYLGAALDLQQAGGRSPGDRAREGSSTWKPQLVGQGVDLPFGGREFRTFDELAAAAAGMGLINVLPDPDGVHRRLPLVVRSKEGLRTNIGLRVLSDMLDVEPTGVLVDPGCCVTLRGAGGSHDPTGDLEIPIDRHGRMLLDFAGPWQELPMIDYAEIERAKREEVLQEILREQVAGRIVVLSESTTGSGDLGATPMDSASPLASLHVTMMENALSGSFLREASHPRTLALRLGVVGAILALALSRRWFSPGVPLLAFAVVAAGTASFVQAGQILPVAAPVLTCVLSLVTVLIARYLWEEQDRNLLRATFEAYFPPQVVERLVADPGLLRTTSQRKELTILFSDIRSFTSHTRSMRPEAVQASLNDYFELMTEIVFRFEGTLDKFIGDGLMVFFGDPEDQPDHASRAVRAAIEMQRAARRLDAERPADGLPIQIRIGIHTGWVAVGNMGSSRRLSYTVLGAAVNLAQRLESAAPVGGILVSNATAERLDKSLSLRRVRPISAKGFEGPVEVLEVMLDPPGHIGS